MNMSDLRRYTQLQHFLMSETEFLFIFSTDGVQYAVSKKTLPSTLLDKSEATLEILLPQV